MTDNAMALTMMMLLRLLLMPMSSNKQAKPVAINNSDNGKLQWQLVIVAVD